MRLLFSLVFVAALSTVAPVAASAQVERDSAQAPTTQTTPSQPPTTQTTPAQAPVTLPKPVREPERREPPKLTNIQIEVTLTDQLGSAAPIKKTVTLITSDGSMGRIRSEAAGFDPGLGRPLPVVLNLDAMPRLVQGNDLIQLSLTIEYRPLKAAVDGKSEGPSSTQLNQSLTVMMTSGKPMIVSQAADPANDRKIVVEAKATILK